MLRAVARQIGGGYAGVFTTLTVTSTSTFSGNVTITKSGIPQLDLINTTGTTKNTQLIWSDNVGPKWRAGMDVGTNNNSATWQLYSDVAVGNIITVSTTAFSVVGSINASTRFDLPSYTVAGVPSVGIAGGMIYVSNETGGAVPAFSDGTNWRRVTDRAIVA